MRRTLVYATLLTGLCMALSVSTIVLSGCSSLANLNIVNPSYSIRDVRPRLNLGIPPSIDFDLTIGVDNPNSVALRLDRLDFDLLVNSAPVLRNVQSNQGIQIPARGIGDVRLTSRVSYNDIRNIWEEIQNVIQGNRARYEIRGNAYYNTPIGQMRFPVTVSSR